MPKARVPLEKNARVEERSRREGYNTRIEIDEHVRDKRGSSKAGRRGEGGGGEGG